MKFELVDKKDLNERHRFIFAELLEMQGKVKGNLSLKADRCKSICIVTCDGIEVAIGAIKEKTESDFAEHKANLLELSSQFDWELGYLFTKPNFRGRNFAKLITKRLIEHFGNENLMASTEINANPGMVKILENHGFELKGNPWESGIHGNLLGLFLKVSKR